MNISDSGGAQPNDFRRLEILYPCLESVMSYFETFLKISPASYWNVSLIHFSHLAYALKVLQRLSILEHPTWDLTYVVEKIDFGRLLEELSNRMREAMRYGGPVPVATSESMNIFANTSSKLEKLKTLFETQMASTQPASQEMDSMVSGDLMNWETMSGFWELDQFNLFAGNWSGL